MLEFRQMIWAERLGGPLGDSIGGQRFTPVSYTHPTLPTTRAVSIPVVSGSLYLTSTLESLSSLHVQFYHIDSQ